MSQALPADQPNQNYVKASPLAAGYLTLPERFFVTPSDPEAKRMVPSLAFVVTHPGNSSGFFKTSGKPFTLIFDLGLRRAANRYIPPQQKHLETRAPYVVEPGVAAQLSSSGSSPADVDAVIISHVHYDHHGDPEDFPNAEFYVGSGALNVLAHGLGGIASHQHFDPNLFAEGKGKELPPPTSAEWKPLGPFPAALDLFGDSSVYVIDTPGHLPGHVNLLCRIGPNKWAAFCGDAYHDIRLLTGEREIGTWNDELGRILCIHLDRPSAEASIKRLRALNELGNVELIAAHDDGWLAKNKARMHPSVL
ncbi:Metallo-hydrolase/oxidoreductase [Rhizodiscina lignyota]|uniref:Metallo-hydrolase/oxidoreductase n=1 Tax=Rhizodiscina lignyota TaxID=1504668 RepID=A0A9P4M4K8_9PEZI|nr:Metallo-hydrolase/oxidoreductase [Rhizodiscina lignyota]